MNNVVWDMGMFTILKGLSHIFCQSFQFCNNTNGCITSIQKHKKNQKLKCQLAWTYKDSASMVKFKMKTIKHQLGLSLA